MLDSDVLERLVRVLPVLRQSEPDFRREFQQKAFLARIPAGHDIFLEGLALNSQEVTYISTRSV